MNKVFKNEHDIIQFFRSFKHSPPACSLNFDDDASLLTTSNLNRVISSDSICQNTHFKMELGGFLIGQKSILINLSDMAAMGAQPEFILINLCLPRHLPSSFICELLNGIAETANDYSVPIIGGDTCQSDSLIISVTIIGHVSGQPLLRSNAHLDHLIATTGPLGGSLFNNRHASFTPRIKEGQLLLNSQIPCSAMDMSDGLASDLLRIIEASKLNGALLDPLSFPVHPSIQHLPFDKQIQHALCDGEDFELLFTFPSSSIESIQQLAFPFFIIGQFCHDKKGIWLSQSEGSPVLCPFEGYSHSL